MQPSTQVVIQAPPEKLRRLAELKRLESEIVLRQLIDAARAERQAWLDTARPEQLPPNETDWSYWLYLAGRGAGKTRSCAEWLADKAITNPGTRHAIVAKTFSDGRDTCVEGESGILGVLNRYDMVGNWNRSHGGLWLKNGSQIQVYSAEEPDRLRGPQNHYAWADELAAWKYAETWDQLNFGLRLGQHPQAVIATTPRPTKLVKGILNDPITVVSRGSTYDNLGNLAPSYATKILSKYEGTRLGRQELYGEILDDVEGALWTNALIEETRVKEAPEITRIVVAIDPAVTTGEDSDSTGIIGVGKGVDGHAYVLHDRTTRDTPAAWARRAIQLWHDMGEIGPIVGEANQGGDLIEATIRAIEPNVPYRKINAKQGKRLRAEPIAALFEQGRVHLVGTFPELEDEMTGWLPDSGYSPDRLDAMVHAIAQLKLAIGSNADAFFESMFIDCPACQAQTRSDLPLCETCHTPIGAAS